jgi:hypothetical protein
LGVSDGRHQAAAQGGIRGQDGGELAAPLGVGGDALLVRQQEDAEMPVGAASRDRVVLGGSP